MVLHCRFLPKAVSNDINPWFTFWKLWMKYIDKRICYHSRKFVTILIIMNGHLYQRDNFLYGFACFFAQVARFCKFKMMFTINIIWRGLSSTVICVFAWLSTHIAFTVFIISVNSLYESIVKFLFIKNADRAVCRNL